MGEGAKRVMTGFDITAPVLLRRASRLRTRGRVLNYLLIDLRPTGGGTGIAIPLDFHLGSCTIGSAVRKGYTRLNRTVGGW